MRGKKILIVEDDGTFRQSLFRHFDRLSYSVVTAQSCAQAKELSQSTQKFDCILLDLGLPDGSGFDLIDFFRSHQPESQVLVLTGLPTLELAVEATRRGAFHFIAKPTQLTEITALVEKSLQQKETAAQISKSKMPTDQIIGASPSLQQVMELVKRVADSDSTVLITGESGTGKELIARAIHNQSDRAKQPFIAINCGAIPSELLESELFGHVKGAFTGAISNRVGRFEQAEGGTLFLDEIGDLEPHLQVKILRVLQERSFEPVGGTKSFKADVRVITATHHNLEEKVANGSFREDLFYRLNVIPLLIPPLRERVSDIPLLINHFIAHFNRTKGRDLTGVTPQALEALSHYAWPGNIRELENLIERMAILKGRGLIDLTDLPQKYHHLTAAHKLINGSAELPERGIDFNSAVDQFENQLILQALERTGWNRNQAAVLLRLNRTTLVEKMKKKGIKPRDEEIGQSPVLHGPDLQKEITC